AFCFFFSSRRRHTRFSRDWSSDVCSSDLRAGCRSTTLRGLERCLEPFEPALQQRPRAAEVEAHEAGPAERGAVGETEAVRLEPEIGRASCRERGESAGGGECLRKKEARCE